MLASEESGGVGVRLLVALVKVDSLDWLLTFCTSREFSGSLDGDGETPAPLLISDDMEALVLGTRWCLSLAKPSDSRVLLRGESSGSLIRRSASQKSLQRTSVLTDCRRARFAGGCSSVLYQWSFVGQCWKRSTICDRNEKTMTQKSVKSLESWLGCKTDSRCCGGG